MSATAILPDNSGFNASAPKQLLNNFKRFLGGAWKVISSALTPLIASVIYLFFLADWASENGGGKTGAFFTTGLSWLGSWLGGIVLYGAIQALKSYREGKLSEYWNSDPKIPRIGFIASVVSCTLHLCLPTYASGVFTSRAPYSGSNGCVYIVNGNPVQIGESIWAMPFKSTAFAVEIKHLYDEKELKSVTLEGVQVIGKLWLDGRLSDNTDHWFGFEEKKKEFTRQLHQVYLDAVAKTSIHDLRKPLVISAETGNLRHNIQKRRLLKRPLKLLFARSNTRGKEYGTQYLLCLWSFNASVDTNNIFNMREVTFE